MASPHEAKRKQEWEARQSMFTNAEVNQLLGRAGMAEAEVKRLREALREGAVACEALAKTLRGCAGEGDRES